MDVVRSGHTLVKFFLVSSYRKNWTFREVQWLRLHTSTVVGVGLIPFQGTVGEGNGTPLQYSCLENPVDGGAW